MYSTGKFLAASTVESLFLVIATFRDLFQHLPQFVAGKFSAQQLSAQYLSLGEIGNVRIPL